MEYALLQKRTFFDREMQKFSLILQAIYVQFSLKLFLLTSSTGNAKHYSANTAFHLST